MLVGQVQLGKATKHVDNSASRRELESLQKKVPDPVTNTICIHHHFTLAIFCFQNKKLEKQLSETRRQTADAAKLQVAFVTTVVRF